MKILLKTKFTALIVIFLMQFIFVPPTTVQAYSNPATVPLLTVANFAVLAKTLISSPTGPTVLNNGHLGIDSPGTCTGFDSPCTSSGNGTINNGAIQYQNAVALQGQTDATAAVTNIGSRSADETLGAQLGGSVLTQGVYEVPAAATNLTGDLTLNGDASSVFIFHLTSTLITDSGSRVLLTGGAQSCNVFWKVDSSATFNGTTTMVGTVLAQASVTFPGGGATLDGRAIAQTAAVTFNNTTVNNSSCAAGTATSSSTAGPAPLINITKVPSPLALPGGPGLVTYDYTVTNIGTVAMSEITVTDDMCTAITYVSGDATGDSKLDTHETWKFNCVTLLSTTTTNIVSATGKANGFTVGDTATATVVVGASVVPPLIHLIKKPNVFLVPVGGGAVTYSYTVTNPGTEPLSNVSVTDDKCTGLPGRVVGHPGDLNKNDLLESNESWSFTCQTKLTRTTTNTGTAYGSANGFTATDTSFVTVVAGSPRLPNTGVNTASKSIDWNTTAMLGILAFSVCLYFARRKQTS